ncbi:MAG: NosD domain-containing protein, partial [Candidatus Anstonellaceae archaeon]
MNRKVQNFKIVFLVYFFIGFFISLNFAIPLTSCQVINIPDVYTLEQNITSSGGTCINITIPDVTIECNGYSIIGSNNSGSIAIYSNQPNTRIYNCVIQNFSSAIQIVGDEADYAIIQNNTINLTYSTSCSITNGVCNGIFLNNADNSTISNNRINVYQFGINLYNSADYNNISNNNASATNYAISLYSNSNYNTITSNNASSTTSYSIYLHSSSNNTITSNNASSTSSNAIYLYSSSNNTISSNNASASSSAIYLHFNSNYNTITSNNASATNNYAIYLRTSSNNTITSNNASATFNAIYLYSSSNYNTITSNNASATQYAIRLSSSSNNNFSNNSLNSSSTSSSSGTIYLESNSNYNRFENNTINQTATTSNAERPIKIDSANHSLFINNKIISSSSSSTPAIEISSGNTNNTFYQNNITSSIWVNDSGTNNYYNISGIGNIYYFVNGTPSWEVLSIYDSNFDNWADAGANYPFKSTTVPGYWIGNGEDAAPYSLAVNIGSCGINFMSNRRYVLSAALSSSSGTCFNITVPNVTLDCQGYSITGANNSGSIAIYSNSSNTTIKNCVIQNFSSAIQIVGDGADYANIQNNTINLTYSTSCSITNGVCNGIFLNNADNSTISNNRINVYQYGINLYNSADYNNISNNNASASFYYAISLSSSSNNTITSNNASSTTSYSIYLSSSSNNTITSNNASATNNYAIYLSSSSNNTISSNNASATFNAIYLSSNSNYNTISSNNASASQVAIYLYSSSNYNTITSNNASATNSYAIRLSSSSNNNFSNNSLKSSSISSSSGTIYLYSNSNYNRFENNTINQTATTSNAERPIKIVSANHSVFINNTIKSSSSSSTPAIEISSGNTNNTFYQNNITSSIWVNDSGTNNYYNTSGIGNIYYFVNGTPSWEVFNIGASSGTWATCGQSRPFNSTTVSGYFIGSAQDWHPYTLNDASVCNTPPSISSIVLTPSSATVLNNLTCNITAIDSQSTTLTAYYEWYKNNVNQTSLAGTYSNLQNNTNTLISTLLSGNLTKGDNWYCRVRVYDGELYSDWNTSNSVTIQSSNPVNVTIQQIINSTNSHSFTIVSYADDPDGGSDIT